MLQRLLFDPCAMLGQYLLALVIVHRNIMTMVSNRYRQTLIARCLMVLDQLKSLMLLLLGGPHGIRIVVIKGAALL